MTITHYTELAESKGLVLTRGDIINDAVVSLSEVRVAPCPQGPERGSRSRPDRQKITAGAHGPPATGAAPSHPCCGRRSIIGPLCYAALFCRRRGRCCSSRGPSTQVRAGGQSRTQSPSPRSCPLRCMRLPPSCILWYLLVSSLLHALIPASPAKPCAHARLHALPNCACKRPPRTTRHCTPPLTRPRGAPAGLPV
jgi:hypothetical protein